MPMNHDDLCRVVSSLERDLAFYSIADIARHIGNIWLDPRSNDFFIGKYGLIAPYKQCLYLLGLTLNTPEPANPQTFSDEIFLEICQRATAIFGYYLEIMTKNETNSSSEGKLSVTHEVAMAAFLHYHNTSRPDGSSEAFLTRIKQICTPFDGQIKDAIGLSATELCSIVEFIAETLQQRVDYLISITSMHRGGFLPSSQSVPGGQMLRDLFTISFSGIESKYGPEVAQNFWQKFVSQRPQQNKLLYPTESFDYEMRPLAQISPGNAMLPFLIWLIRAIHDECVEILMKSPARDKYLRGRDKVLELNTYLELSKLYQKSVISFTGVYETPDLHFEHDIIFYDQESRKLIICECKAGTLREPLRDREKSFIRVRDDFRKNTGIQKAYEQGNRIRAKLLLGEEVPLYSREKLMFTLKPGEIEGIYVICLTEDNYGPLACDLSLLLQKTDAEKYPWAVSFSRLETFIEAIVYRGWGAEDLYMFLEQREQLHGRVIVDDEMEIMGMFVRNRSLEAIFMSDHEQVILDGTWGNVFHEIFYAKRGGHRPNFTPRWDRIDLRD